MHKDVDVALDRCGRIDAAVHTHTDGAADGAVNADVDVAVSIRTEEVRT